MPRYLITAIADVKYYLVLNPMYGRMEGQHQFGPYETKEAARAFYDAEKVEAYSETGPSHFSAGDVTYRKNFKKDGPLEWMNPLSPAELDKPGEFGHGFHEVTTYTDVTVGAQIHG